MIDFEIHNLVKNPNDLPNKDVFMWCYLPTEEEMEQIYGVQKKSPRNIKDKI